MRWWIFSYLSSNWSLVLCVVVIVAALIAVTVFARNWKAAIAAAAIVAAGFAYQWIDKQGYQRAQAEQLAEKLEAKDKQIEALELRIYTVNAANELIAMQAVTDANELSELGAKANETPANAAVAIKRDAALRVREFRRQALGGAAAKGRAAAGTGGHPAVLPIRKWGLRSAGS